MRIACIVRLSGRRQLLHEHNHAFMDGPRELHRHCSRGGKRRRMLLDFATAASGTIPPTSAVQHPSISRSRLPSIVPNTMLASSTPERSATMPLDPSPACRIPPRAPPRSRPSPAATPEAIRWSADTRPGPSHGAGDAPGCKPPPCARGSRRPWAGPLRRIPRIDAATPALPPSPRPRTPSRWVTRSHNGSPIRAADPCADSPQAVPHPGRGVRPVTRTNPSAAPPRAHRFGDRPRSRSRPPPAAPARRCRTAR